MTTGLEDTKCFHCGKELVKGGKSRWFDELYATLCKQCTIAFLPKKVIKVTNSTLGPKRIPKKRTESEQLERHVKMNTPRPTTGVLMGKTK